MDILVLGRHNYYPRNSRIDDAQVEVHSNRENVHGPLNLWLLNNLDLPLHESVIKLSLTILLGVGTVIDSAGHTCNITSNVKPGRWCMVRIAKT